MRKVTYPLMIFAGLLVLACSRAETTVDDVVYRTVQAQGGAEALAAVEDQVSTWDSKVVMPMGDEMVPMEAEFVCTYKRPNRIKWEGKGPDGAVMFVSVFDGTTGWQMMGPQAREMTQDEIEETLVMAETWIDGWHNYSEKGMELEMLQDSVMDGKTYHVIKVTDRFGNVSTNFCNIENGMVERSEMTMTDAMTLEKVASTMTFADYYEHDGFMMPQKVANYDKEGELTWEMTLKELNNNVGVSDDAFAKPGGAM